jgi:hypothetical protein
MSVHSGKKLSEVPYAEIEIGMETISAINTPGKVSRKDTKKIRDDDNWLTIQWVSGRMSCDYHFNFDKVTVK